MFPPHIWNHFETIGPRTNNHVEVFNIQYSFSIHPNIYQLIILFRQMETNISQKYIKRVKGAKSKAYRKPIYVQRDEVIFILKPFCIKMQKVLVIICYISQNYSDLTNHL